MKKKTKVKLWAVSVVTFAPKTEKNYMLTSDLLLAESEGEAVSKCYTKVVKDDPDYMMLLQFTCICVDDYKKEHKL